MYIRNSKRCICIGVVYQLNLILVQMYQRLLQHLMIYGELLSHIPLPSLYGLDKWMCFTVCVCFVKSPPSPSPLGVLEIKPPESVARLLLLLRRNRKILLIITNPFQKIFPYVCITIHKYFQLVFFVSETINSNANVRSKSLWYENG